MRNPVIYGAYDMLMINYDIWRSCSLVNISKIFLKNGYYRPTFPDWHLIHALDISWWHQWHQWHLPGLPAHPARSKHADRFQTQRPVSRCLKNLQCFREIYHESLLKHLSRISMDIYGYLLSTDFGSMVPLASCRWLCMAPCSHRLQEAGWTEPPMHPDTRKTVNTMLIPCHSFNFIP